MPNGFNNDTMFAKNVDFRGVVDVQPQVVLNGQLLIGSTATPNIRVGTLTPGAGISITNGPGTITIANTGVITANTITGDTGGALTPNWLILGQQAGTIAVMDTVGTGPSTLRVEDRTWPTQLVVDPSAVVGLRGTYATITLAMADAVSGQTIFIRPGTYTESFTIKAGVNLTSYGFDNVIIVGKITMTAAGSSIISNIKLRTNSDYFLEITGSAASIVYLDGCYLDITNASGINSTTSNVDSQIWVKNCIGNIANTFHVFDIDHGFIEILSSFFLGGSAGVNTADNDSGVFFKYTQFQGPITTSGTSSITIANSLVNNGQNGTITVGGTGNNFFTASSFQAGTSSAISVSAGCTLRLAASDITSTNTNALVGAGIIQQTGNSFSGSKLISTTTQNNVASWTPALNFGGAAVGLTTSSAIGSYARVGDLVYFDMQLILTAKGSSTGTANITGFPIVAPRTTILNLSCNALTFAGQVNARIGSGSATINLDSWATTGARAVLTDTAFVNSTFIQITGIMITGT